MCIWDSWAGVLFLPFVLLLFSFFAGDVDRDWDNNCLLAKVCTIVISSSTTSMLPEGITLWLLSALVIDVLVGVFGALVWRASVALQLEEGWLSWCRNWCICVGMGAVFWICWVLVQSQKWMPFEPLCTLFPCVEECHSFITRANLALICPLWPNLNPRVFSPLYLHFNYYVLTHEHSIRILFMTFRYCLDESLNAQPKAFGGRWGVTFKTKTLLSWLNKEGTNNHRASISNGTSATLMQDMHHSI